MSYTCYASSEHVRGQIRNLVPIEVRKVNYVNYSVTMRGNKLFKQYMGTTTGFETIKEVPVSPASLDEFTAKYSEPTIKDEKTIVVEFEPFYIKFEDKSRAISKNNVIVNDKIKEPEKEVVSYNNYDMDGYDKD